MERVHRTLSQVLGFAQGHDAGSVCGDADREGDMIIVPPGLLQWLNVVLEALAANGVPWQVALTLVVGVAAAFGVVFIRAVVGR